jgi:hypothetical protein
MPRRRISSVLPVIPKQKRGAKPKSVDPKLKTLMKTILDDTPEVKEVNDVLQKPEKEITSKKEEVEDEVELDVINFAKENPGLSRADLEEVITSLFSKKLEDMQISQREIKELQKEQEDKIAKKVSLETEKALKKMEKLVIQEKEKRKGAVRRARLTAANELRHQIM